MNGRITDAVEVGTGQSAEEATVHGKEKVSTVPPVVSPVPTSAGVRRIVYISRLTRVLDPELTAGALGGSPAIRTRKFCEPACRTEQAPAGPFP